MANSNGSFGLRPIGIVGQGSNTTGATEYRIASNNNTKIHQKMVPPPARTSRVLGGGSAAPWKNPWMQIKRCRQQRGHALSSITIIEKT